MPRTEYKRRQALADKLVPELQKLIAMPPPRPAAVVAPVARDLVRLRSLFDYEGRPDWAGRSQAYRDTIYQIYRDAELPSDSVDSLQANLRYHIGNAVREVAPPEDLEALGLDPAGPRKRAVRYRQEAKSSRPPAMVRMAPGVVSSVMQQIADPFALLVMAKDAVAAARETAAGSPEAAQLEDLARQVIEEAFGLVAQLQTSTGRRAGQDAIQQS